MLLVIKSLIIFIEHNSTVIIFNQKKETMRERERDRERNGKKRENY